MSTNQKITAFAFDASQIAPSVPMEAVPAGWYNVAITDGELSLTEGGNGKRVQFEWTILDGPFKGRKIFDGFNVVHSSAQAMEISQRQVSAICHATGVLQMLDVQQQFNRPHQIKVSVDAPRIVGADGETLNLPPGAPMPPNCKQYESRNRFAGAKPGQGEVAAAPVGLPPGANPNWARNPVPANGLPAAAAPAPTLAPSPAIAMPAPAAAGSPWIPPAATAPVAAPMPAPAPAPAPMVAPPVAAPAPAPAPAAAAPERQFSVYLNNTVQPPIPESKLAAAIAAGQIPPNTPVNPGTTQDGWKPANVWLAPAPAAAAPAGAQGPWMR